jgi:alanine racemase
VGRSEITIDLRALRRNTRRLLEEAGGAELWAVVKADAYGHGALDCARAALEAGASALCVATVEEGRRLREHVEEPRILVLGPLSPGEDAIARSARLDVVVSTPDVPDGVAAHVKVDTGMGRFGMRPEDLGAVPPSRVAGLMSHLATADEADEAFARDQIALFATLASRFPGAVAHLANSAATLRYPSARFDAVRCGVALYGLSPFGDDPATHGLEPVLSWRSHVALAKTLEPGESTGYGRRFVAGQRVRIGLVPVGYADGFRCAMTGAHVLVEGARRQVLGAVSMDSFAVELDGEEPGATVTLVGDGLTAEEHARHLGTINYEITCSIRSGEERARRTVLDG